MIGNSVFSWCKRNYCTNSIDSYIINEDKLVNTFYFIEEEYVVKKGFWNNNIKSVKRGWILDYFIDTETQRLRRCEYIDKIIIEELKVYDINKVEEHAHLAGFGIKIENSNFDKWFKEHFDIGDDINDSDFYYKTITDRCGKVLKIEIYSKGSIEIKTAASIVTYRASIDYNRSIKLAKDIERCILKYPFFKTDGDGHILFYNLNDNNEYDVFYIV